MNQNFCGIGLWQLLLGMKISIVVPNLLKGISGIGDQAIGQLQMAKNETIQGSIS